MHQYQYYRLQKVCYADYNGRSSHWLHGKFDIIVVLPMNIFFVCVLY